MSLTETLTKHSKEKLHKNRHKKLLEFKDLQKLSRELKAKNKKLVFTSGSFDLLNPGHCRYLSEAKSKGDVLIVGVASDESESIIKGDSFPLVGDKIRAELLAYLKVVDYVTIVNNEHPHAHILMLKPDIVFTSEQDWITGVRTKLDTEVVKSYGGEIYKRKKDEHYHTVNSLAMHIANFRVLQILDNYLKTDVNIEFESLVTKLKPINFFEQTPHAKNAYNPNSNIMLFSELENLRALATKNKKRLVLVSGSYDLLHVGHARFIEQASILGDILVVAIPSDEKIRQLKGVGRPVIHEHSRAYVLASLDIVDKVVIFNDSTIYQTLEKLKPDIFFTVSEEWNNGYKDSKEFKLVKRYGGSYAFSKRQGETISASGLIDKVANKKVREIFKDCMDEEKIQKVSQEKSKF